MSKLKCRRFTVGGNYNSTHNMMGLITFLLVDFGTALLSKNDVKLYVKTIMIIGIMALGGFFMAICIHAPLRGYGDVVIGIKSIFRDDVLRRTVGADLNNFPEAYWSSFNASVWETFSKYFHFDTEIITGISGNLFPLFCLMPLVIFAFEYVKGKLNIENVIMYAVTFISTISWLCLAKGHSYLHTRLNYVLWYLGFVQVSLYIILEKIRSFCKQTEETK